MTEIVFNIIDWNGYHEGDYNNDNDNDSDSDDDVYKSYVIEIFGRTLEGKSVYAKLNNYTPYFYIELSDPIWNSNNITLLQKYIQSKKVFYGDCGQYFSNCDIVERYKLYGFTGEKPFKFIRLVFTNQNIMRKVSYHFRKGIRISSISRNYLKFKIHEANIDPLLKCGHHLNIKTCGWVKIKKYNTVKSNKNTDISLETIWKNIKPYNSDNIAPLCIMSFDIECTSIDGSFPQAYRKGDKIIQIGSTFNILGQTDCYYKHMVTLNSCDPIDGVDVESYDNEKNVISAWIKMIQKQDPDIITGWNTFGFDNSYINDRAIMLGLENEILQLSRVSERKLPFIIKELSSAALGDNKLKYFNTPGRVQIDLMKVVQRDHNLNSYKLDSVAEEFINGDVVYIKPRKRSKITELEIKNVKDIILGNFIKLYYQINQFDNFYYEDGLKLQIIKIKENIITIDNLYIDDKYKDIKWKWGLVKDDIKPADIFRLQEGSSADRQLVAKYCIMDCILCNKLMEKLCILLNNIAMATVCGVPLPYIFLRGQGIKVLSLVAKYCRKRKYILPVLDNKKKDDSGYEGATVFKPNIGFYNRPVAVLDYASLYPSSMIHRNLSHEMLIEEIGGKYDNLEEYKYRNVTYKNSDGSETVCRYAQKEDALGIMPTILQDLLTQRKKVKKLMKSEKDPFKNSVLDGQQLALKCTANSLYGQLGSSFSPICKKEIAASTTATGRYMLELARDYTEEDFPEIINNIYKNINNKKELNKIYKKELTEKLYNDEEIKNKITNIVNKICINYILDPKTVYGDTDSVFIDFQIKDKLTNEFLTNEPVLEYAIDLGIVCGMLIKSRLEFPHDLEYEKTFWPFCIFSKKRYIGNKYEFNPKKFKQNYNGIVLKRRDNAPIVKEIVGGIANILLNEKDVQKSIEYVNTSVEKLLRGEYPLKYFITSKTLKGKYADRTRIAHAVLADRMKDRDPGSAPNINERIPYVSVIVDEKEIYTKKVENNNICIQNSLKYFVNLEEILKLYEKIKLVKDKNEIATLEKEYIFDFNALYGKIVKLEADIKIERNSQNKQKLKIKLNELQSTKILANNIYDKIRKDFVKFLDKYDDFRKELKEKDIICKIKELIIKHGNASPNIIQGDRIEHPNYIIDNNLKIDYLFYLTNQILKPSSQFYSFNIENIKGFHPDMLNELNKDDFEHRCDIAGKLLYDKILLKVKENKLREREVEKSIKNINKTSIFKTELEEIDYQKNYEKNKIKAEKERLKEAEREKKRAEREKKKAERERLKAEKAKNKKPRKKKVVLENKDGDPVKNIGDLPDP